ncbi:MAG: hypothetical protein J6Y42_00820 [Bacilli bacterium]|nr:hypothetical protein [Bacilli bacterium]
MIDALYDKFKEWSKGGSVYIYSDSHFSDLDCYKLRFPDEYEEQVARLCYSNTLLCDCTHSDKEAEEFSQAHENYKKLKETAFVEKFDKMQIDNINKLCNKCDTLVILGDVGNVECVKKLKAGRKILIMGNHDKGKSNYVRIREIVKCFDSSKLTREDVAIGDLNKGWTLKTEDNKLFDEVYEGQLFIGQRILLSHEPINFDFALNIHGHVHSKEKSNKCSFNACAEHINYTPVNLKDILNSGIMKNIKDIHRDTIDEAIKRKLKKKEEK